MAKRQVRGDMGATDADHAQRRFIIANSFITTWPRISGLYAPGHPGTADRRQRTPDHRPSALTIKL